MNICATCRYWNAATEQSWPAPTRNIGECRRHPPTVSRWPSTDAGDWCGEFREWVSSVYPEQKWPKR